MRRSSTPGRFRSNYVLRDKTRLAEAQQELAHAQWDVETGMYDLSVLLGLERPRQLTLTDVLGFVPVEYNAAEALKSAAANRPELAAVRARIEAASAQISVARAAYQPQLAATLISSAMTGEDIMNRGATPRRWWATCRCWTPAAGARRWRWRRLSSSSSRSASVSSCRASLATS